MKILYNASPPDATSGEPDSITLLTCASGLIMAKRIQTDGQILGYDRARTFSATETPIADFDDLIRTLCQISSRPDICVVRGALVDGPQRQDIRRLLYDDCATGERATLRDVPRSWLALDIDALPLPPGVDHRDLQSCVQAVVAKLPPELQGRRCFAQATASHGLKSGIRIRVWFWLSRPIIGRDLKAWLHTSPVDKAIFNAAQPIYTAAPVFADGVADHLPCRHVVVEGEPVVAVPLAVNLAPAGRTIRAATTNGTSHRPHPVGRNAAWNALRDGTMRVAFAVEGERHATLIREAMRLVTHVNTGALSEDLMRAALGDAFEQAGKPRAEANAAVSWALAHGGAT